MPDGPRLWAWGFSDVLTNISSAVFEERIVGSALDAVNGIKPIWEYYDLDYAVAKIEVKSMAHLRTGRGQRGSEQLRHHGYRS